MDFVYEKSRISRGNLCTGFRVQEKHDGGHAVFSSEPEALVRARRCGVPNYAPSPGVVPMDISSGSQVALHAKV